MSATLSDTIHDRVRSLPPEKQQEVWDFVDALSQTATANGSCELKTWLCEARQLRAQLPETSDSVEIVRQLRNERSHR